MSRGTFTYTRTIFKAHFRNLKALFKGSPKFPYFSCVLLAHGSDAQSTQSYFIKKHYEDLRNELGNIYVHSHKLLAPITTFTCPFLRVAQIF